MKITIVTGPFLPVPPLLGGAIERLWHQLAEEFATQGHEITIVCRKFVGQPNDEVVNGVRYLRRSRFPRSGNLFLDLVWAFLYSFAVVRHLPNADVLVTNCVGLPFIAAWLRPQAGAIAVCVHRYPKADVRLYGKSALFMTPSSAIAYVIKQKFSTLYARTRIIGNPIRTDVFYPQPNATQDHQVKTILYVGRVHPEKGIDLLIHAFALVNQSLPSTRLRIVGPSDLNQGGGGTIYLSALTAKASSLPIEFCEPIFDIEKLAHIYRSADVFCYPSLAEYGETFGLAVLEAMACGVPPVVSSLACFTDFIEDGENGLIFDHRTPNAAQRLSQKLVLLLQDSQINLVLSQQAAKKARSFTLDKIAVHYLAEFEKLIQR